MPTPLAALLLIAMAAIGLFAGTQPAQAKGTAVKKAPNPGWRGPGYGYDIANSPYFSSGDIKTTPILNIGKLERKGLLRTKASPEFNQSISVGSNISKYSESLNVAAGISGGAGAFRGSVSASFGGATKASAETSFITNYAEVRRREYYIEDGSRKATLMPYLTPAFKADINNERVKPEKLFRTYGTHLLYDVGFGGLLSMNYRYQNASEESTTALTLAAEASYATINGSASSELEKKAKNLAENSSLQIKSSGGTAPIDVTSINAAKASYQKWEGSVNANNAGSLAFIGGPSADDALAHWSWPIWEFAKTAKRREAIQAEFEKELQENAAYFRTLQEPVSYVKEIYVVADPSQQNAKAEIEEALGGQEGVVYPEWDLNRGAGGEYIYIGYSTTTNPDEAVTAVAITTGQNQDHYEKNGVTYRSSNIDLNKGAGGEYIWLSFTHDPRAAAEPGKVVRSLGIEIEENKTKNVEIGSGWAKKSTDLNKGAGGAYIYLWSQLQVPSSF